MRPQDEHQAPAGHPDLIGLIDEEIALQDKSLNLIAAANYLSVSVQKAMDARLSNIHCEGYPGRRYHTGQQQADAIEGLAIARAKAVFGVEHANVRHVLRVASVYWFLTSDKPELPVELSALAPRTQSSPPELRTE